MRIYEKKVYENKYVKNELNTFNVLQRGKRDCHKTLAKYL